MTSIKTAPVLCHTLESYLNLHFRRVLPLKAIREMEGKVEQSRAGTQRRLWKLTGSERILSEQEQLMAEDGSWTRRRITNICRAGLVTRMESSSFRSSMLVGLLFKCMLLMKLFWTTYHCFYHFSFQLILTLQFQCLHLRSLFLPPWSTFSNQAITLPSFIWSR